MDFVYICKDGDNEELRYSIRSVVKNTNYHNIWVVGGEPDWYIGNYIDVKQDKNIYANVFNNMKAICLSNNISENFVLMNDDFFIMKKIEHINNYNGGLLLDKIEKYEDLTGRTLYINKLNNTYSKLIDLGINKPLNYELHIPILINKNKLNKVLKDARFCSFRSIYGNMFLKDTESIDDVKVYSKGKLETISYKYSNNSIYLSSQDESFIQILPILNKKFNKPSIFEEDKFN